MINHILLPYYWRDLLGPRQAIPAGGWDLPRHGFQIGGMEPNRNLSGVCVCACVRTHLLDYPSYLPENVLVLTFEMKLQRKSLLFNGE